MKPHEFVAHLVHRAGGPSKVAKAMGKAGFQPTLHKYCDGKVLSPKRETAERIARFFKLSPEVLYASTVPAELVRSMLDAAYEPPAEPIQFAVREAGERTYLPSPADALEILAGFLAKLSGLQQRTALEAVRYALEEPGDATRRTESRLVLEAAARASTTEQSREGRRA